MGMWIDRDKRREAIPPDDQEVSAAAPCLRGLVVASPAWEDPAAEFGVDAGEGPETLSQEIVAWRRIRPGLEEDSEAARSPGEEEE